MEHNKGSRLENHDKVRNAIESSNKTFTIGEIQEKTKLNYVQCKKYLTSWEELGLIKYSETTKIYMRLDNI